MKMRKKITLLALATALTPLALPMSTRDSLAGTPLFEIGNAGPNELAGGIGIESVFANGAPRAILEVSYSGAGAQDSALRYFAVQAQSSLDTQGNVASVNITLVPIANLELLGPGNKAEYLVTEFKRDIAIGSSRVRITPLRFRGSIAPEDNESGAIMSAAADLFGFTYFSNNLRGDQGSGSNLQGVSSEGMLLLGFEEIVGGYQFQIDSKSIRAIRLSGGLSDVDMGFTAALWSADATLMKQLKALEGSGLYLNADIHAEISVLTANLLTLALQGGIRLQGATGLGEEIDDSYNDYSPYLRLSVGGRL